MLQTTHAPAQRKLSHIPEPVVEFFAAQGKAVTLNNGSSDSIARMAGLYRFPVQVDDFGEDADEMQEYLKREGYQFGQDGTIRRADCLLFAVDEAKREELREDAALLWHRQKLQESEQTADQLNRAGVGITFKNRGEPSIRGHVFDGGRKR